MQILKLALMKNNNRMIIKNNQILNRKYMTYKTLFLQLPWIKIVKLKYKIIMINYKLKIMNLKRSISNKK